MRYLLGLFVISGIIGAATGGGPPARDPRQIAYDDAIDTAKQMILTTLKDPDSAKFGNVFFGRKATICGTVNAKNSFGGYTGAQVFTIDAKYVRVGDGAVSNWNKNCATE